MGNLPVPHTLPRSWANQGWPMSQESERTFEDLQRELDDVVARLERGDVAVDDAIALFRRGEELYRACVARLEAAELRIEEVSPTDAGST
jgi:exodeoxyribonuclease VII small subunit